MRRLLAAALAFAFVATTIPARAADRCTTGKQCGEACIAVTDTCHIATPDPGGGSGVDTATLVGYTLASLAGSALLVWLLVEMAPGRYSAVAPTLELGPDGASVGAVVRF